jgi:hypothetical protein
MEIECGREKCRTGRPYKSCLLPIIYHITTTTTTTNTTPPPWPVNFLRTSHLSLSLLSHLYSPLISQFSPLSSSSSPTSSSSSSSSSYSPSYYTPYLTTPHLFLLHSLSTRSTPAAHSQQPTSLTCILHFSEFIFVSHKQNHPSKPSSTRPCNCTAALLHSCTVVCCCLLLVATAPAPPTLLLLLLSPPLTVPPFAANNSLFPQRQLTFRSIA